MQSSAEARIVIEDVIAGEVPNDVSLGAPPRVVARQVARFWAIPAAALLAVAFGLGWTWAARDDAMPAVGRFVIPAPDGTELQAFQTAGPNLAVSPDGAFVAFVAGESQLRQTIWIRALDSLELRRLDRTEGARYPFWSPDSRQIAYFANGKLMRIPAAGGAPITIADAPDSEGGSWYQAEGEDGVIVFSPGQSGPLHQVAAAGGPSTALTTLEDGESAHVFPQFLPDGRGVLFTARGDRPGVYVQGPGSTERTLVLSGLTRAVYSPPGFLLYVRDSVLLAHRVNLDTRQLEGEPVTLADDVRNSANVGNAGLLGRNAFTVSPSLLVYRGVGGSPSTVRWYGSDGIPGELVLTSGVNSHIELSPDDTMLAVVQGTGMGRDVWVKTLSGGQFSRLTDAAGFDIEPRWSPDSRRLAYTRPEGFFYTDVGSDRHVAVPFSARLALQQWTPDGKYLLVSAPGSGVRLLPVPEGREASPPTPGQDATQQVSGEAASFLRVSPDGKRVAYASQTTGMPQIMVAAFPSFADRQQVSVDGGEHPRWRADGKELFFSTDDGRIMVVAITANGVLRAGPPRLLFRTRPAARGAGGSANYAATADGQRFLVRELVEGISTSLIEPLYVVTNWQALVPGD